ncbi:hypothetical protein WR25_04032 [Diploscapter pachys]|uniref:GRIP domain-containing protein n=1 Tax=Diploscapter pachys TaxID=2018661 RepID=A0A2A2KLW5_9BILA|nr:hypothetical protein WR25_04032 [Diploscapter pachys]
MIMSGLLVTIAFEHRKSLPQSRVPGLPNNSKIPVPITANQQNGENSKESTPTSNKTTPILAVTKQQPQPKPKMAEVKQEAQSSAVSSGKPILAEKKTTNLREIETQTEEEEKKCLSDKSTECKPVALNFGTQTTEPEPAPEIIKLDKAIMAQIIEIVDEESRSAERKQIEQLQAENATLRLKVDRMQREETEASTSREALLAEIESLRQQVAESNNYLDQVDVEAEQQYTELTGEIDELIEVVQKKDAEIAAFKEQLAEKQKTEAKLNENLESYKAVMQRQKEIIENLREELDAEIAKSAQLLKEKERLTNEATTAKERMSESMLAKEALISIQLDDLHRELDKQKTIINGTSVAQIVNKWEKRVEALENSLRERDVIIHTQSQLIKELRRGTQTPSPNQISSGSNNNNLHRHSTSNGHPQRTSNNSSMDSFYRDGLDPRSRDQLLNFIMSDRPAQLANIFAIGRILDLNPHEEKLIERFLARETYG